MSIGAINNINPLQRQFGVSQGFGAAQAAPAANNPFAAANPLGQGANAFSAGFGAQQQGGGIEALLASAGGSQAPQAPKKDEGDIVKLLISLLTGANKGDKKAADTPAADPNAAVAQDAAAEEPATSGCQDANGDGACDADGMDIEDCQSGNCPDGNCG
ncbi:MAG: hypothetical protein QE263_07140 [Vampirovibrionales bacterium]|nr:hypothetical protein [Vampirovibrionales bacterium]